MTTRRTKPTIDVDRLKELFGDPPILRSESHEQYDQIFSSLTACFAPQDFLELTLLKHLCDAIWLVKRYTRHQTVLLERLFDKRVEAWAQISSRKPTQANTLTSGAPTEQDHNFAITGGIALQMQLDRLIADTTARFNDTLVLFERHRGGLGPHLREAVAEVIEVDYEEIQTPVCLTAPPESQTNRSGTPIEEAPSIVPSEEGTDDVTKENRSEQAQ